MVQRANRAALAAAVLFWAVQAAPLAQAQETTSAPAEPIAGVGQQADVPQVDEAAFRAWLADIQAQARAQGIGAATVDAVLGRAQPVQRVIELDRRQPEFTQTFWTYMDRAVSADRIAQGQAMLRRHADLLAQVERDYGVQPRFLVAFWGLETNFGANFGSFRVIDSLATLAFDTRRSDFFRAELFDALHILDAGHVTPDRMVGSWAGAMGHLQFMPSTYRRFAVDRSGDGRADLWGSLSDVFASGSNYLSSEGWKGDETWGREVRLPDGFDLDLAGLNQRRQLAEWARLGLRRADGGPLPVVEGMEASVVLPAGVRGPAFVVYDNFRTTMKWNRSILYALAVGHLADRLVGLPPLLTQAPADVRPLRRAEVEEIQSLLNALGHDAGPVDGLAGSQTRDALRAFQRAVGVPPDGHADPAILDRLRNEAGQRGATPAENGSAASSDG